MDDPEEFHRAFEAVHQRSIQHFHLPAFATRMIGYWGELEDRLLGRPAILCLDRIRDLFTPYWVHSSARLEQVLDPFEWTPLEEACRETDAWYRSRGVY
jgi:hypothetical protein